MPKLTPVDQLQFALPGILPAKIGCGVDLALTEAEAFQYVEEGQHLARAVVARRNEFICGRRCARAALAQVGQAACALPTDANGLPIWPNDYVGSISHSRGLCCAVAATKEVVTGLGVDIEKTTRLSAPAMKRVVHPLEADCVGDDQALGSLLFSAKEAFFKAQFPVWRAQPNFQDLALQIHADTQHLSVLKMASHLPTNLSEATIRMVFRYQFFGDYVVTMCWLRPV